MGAIAKGSEMKTRKKYKPKPVLRDPLTWVINGFRRLDNKIPEVMNLNIEVHHAASALAKGNATRHEIDFLLTAANISLALIEQGIGEGFDDVAIRGRDAVVAISGRGWEHNRFTAKGLELTAINELIELHDAQFEVITMSDLETATRKVIKMIQAKRIHPLQCHPDSEPCTSR